MASLDQTYVFASYYPLINSFDYAILEDSTHFDHIPL